jgi:hypothetical protein
MTSQAHRHSIDGVETNGSSPKNLPQDIQTALQKHDAALRLSYVEIVSGINRLLRQGIPKEVISQVATQAVEAVAKDFNSLTYQDFYSRNETQPDAPNGKILDSFEKQPICATAIIARGRSLRLSSLRTIRLTGTFGLGGAVGLLLLSAMLYVSYRPYAEIVQRFIHTGDESRIRELSEFLGYTLVPLGAQGFKNRLDFVFYFWLGVTALCVIALLLMAVRHFRNRPRAKATT